MIPPQTTAVPVSRSFFWLPVAGLRHVIEVVPIAITDARTGTAHLVTDSAAAWGRLAGGYVAVCGMQVLAASLSPPRRPDRWCSRESVGSACPVLRRG